MSAPYIITGTNRGLHGFWTGQHFSDSLIDALPFANSRAAKLGLQDARKRLAMRHGWKDAARVTLKIRAHDYQDNPVPPLRSQVAASERAYTGFTGHPVKGARRVKVKDFRVGWPLGKLDGVLYSTVRDGKPEKYHHRFRAQSRPLLVVNSDGTRLGIVGGRFQVTDSGIEDA